MLVLDGGGGSNTDDLARRDFSNVEWAGWHFSSYATVVTLLDPLPYPILFVNKSNSGNTTRCWVVSASFSCSFGSLLLLSL